MSSHIIGIHHIGLVVDNIIEMSKFYKEKLCYSSESGVINEAKQKVYVHFLTLGGYRIELIQPINEDSPVYRFLKKGGGLNHICYISDDIEISTQYLRKEHSMLPVSSEWSASIKNCKVKFLAKPDGEIIELMQPLDGTKYYPPIDE
ncbi:MAG: VOC family protein [Bacteroidetes bacterium]|nr:VOC family protein [Bacteroidota bacterium]